MPRLHVWIIALGIIVCLKISFNAGYDGGLIFYDPVTKQKLLPPIVTASKYGSNLRMPFMGQPCTCQGKECGCCVGMKIDFLDFDQRSMLLLSILFLTLCANVTYRPRDLEMELDIILNRKAVIMYKLSAHNPPPFCIPVPLPIPVNLCMQVYDIQTVGTNLHLCMKWIVKVLSNDIFMLHFNCIEVGTDGIHLAKPSGGQSMGTSIGDEQVNSHIFDHVNFDRRRSIHCNSRKRWF